MNSNYTSIVIIDNYPVHIQVYRNLLKEIESSNERFSFKISEANCCDSALNLLDKIDAAGKGIDLVLLAINIPASERKTHLSGEDIGVEIRERFQDAKILINTVSINNYRINTIFKRVNPEGFLIRSDINLEALKSSIERVLKDPPSYSKKILNFLKKTTGHDFSLDEWDIKLLYELSLGRKMKDMPEVLPLSLGAIEKRKRRLKVQFDMEEADDHQFLEMARKYGFI